MTMNILKKLILLPVLLHNAAFLASNNANVDSYFDMSLSELMNISVISSTREPEELNKAPNIIYAITDQQIKNRGYKTLLDVLKHIPGWDFDSPHGGWVGQYARIRGTAYSGPS
jgi:outer membrane receptor for ferrienterochelin and colicin